MADDVQMSAAHAAEHLGLKVGTLHAYRRDGLMPSADGMIGRTPWWWQSTIDTWWESRPGRGTGGGRPRRGQRVRAKSSDETPGVGSCAAPATHWERGGRCLSHGSSTSST